MITLLYGKEARAHLLLGWRKLFQPVAASMGPSGRNFYFEERDNTYLTKDGATIARWIVGAGLLDRFERAGAAMIRRASQKTEEEAGDATSAATILAYRMATEGVKYIDDGANVIEIERGMRAAYDEVAKYLDSVARPAKDRKSWEDIAFISSRDREVATMIADAMEKVTPEGHIRIEAGDDWEEHDMKLEIKNGMTFPRGFTHDIEMNDYKKQACILRNVPIFVTDLSFFTERDTTLLGSLCESVYKSGHKEMVIIGKKFAGIAVDLIKQLNIPFNESRGQKGMRVLTIESPGYGSSFTAEFCDDIAVLTGATFIGEDRPIDTIKLKDTGICQFVEAGRKETTIIGKQENEDAIQRRVAEIDMRYDKAKGEEEQKRMKERKAALTTGMAVITVGGRNTENIGEKKARVEDAHLAAKCAYEEGIVPGGGVAYIHASTKLTPSVGDFGIGGKIVQEALRVCTEQIALNCCLDPSNTARKAQDLKEGQSLNMSKGSAEVVEAFDAGIVDPVKSLKSALLNAIETSLIFLTTETVGVTIPEDKNGKPIFEVLAGDASKIVAKE